jgi:hypothetical protein
MRKRTKKKIPQKVQKAYYDVKWPRHLQGNRQKQQQPRPSKNSPPPHNQETRQKHKGTTRKTRIHPYHPTYYHRQHQQYHRTKDLNVYIGTLTYHQKGKFIQRPIRNYGCI